MRAYSAQAPVIGITVVYLLSDLAEAEAPLKSVDAV